MADAKAIFDAFLVGKPGRRPPLVPLLAGLAARAGGVPYREMSSDPGAWTACLTKAATLFEPDAMVVGFDPTLSIEAAGGTVRWHDDLPEVAPLSAAPGGSVPGGGRLAAAIETAARLFPLLAPRLGCIAAMAGPILLATQAFGAERAAAGLGELRQFQVAIVEALCKTRPHLLLFIEGNCLTGIGPTERRAYNTLRNVARHFDVATAVQVSGHHPRLLADLPVLGLDFCLLGNAADGAAPGLEAVAALGDGVRGVGLPAIAAAGGAARLVAELTTGRAEGRRPNLMLTTEAALDADADIRAVRTAMDALRDWG